MLEIQSPEMNGALKAKLERRLKGALGSGPRRLDAAALKSALVDIRDLLEASGEIGRYRILKFHCDWILHPELTNSRVQKIIQAVDAECVKSLKKAGLQQWPDSVGSDFFGPVSQQFCDELQNRFSFHGFESELRSFLARHDIVELPDPSLGMYRPFEVLYCQLIEDRMWSYTNKKSPTSCVNRARAQMIQREGYLGPPPWVKAFPYDLRWTFSWNDEERLILVTEFLADMPHRGL